MPEKSLVETELQAMLLSGDPASFQLLYKRFSKTLFGIVLRLVRDEDQAADILQDAFVKIWQNASKYDPSKGTVFTWMLNVTRNLALDKLRSAEFHKSQQTFPIEDHVYTAERVNKQPDTEQGEAALEMVRKLPEAAKRLIEMVYVEGYTQAEVAEQLNIPLGTVKTRIRTTLQQLRKKLTA